MKIGNNIAESNHNDRGSEASKAQAGEALSGVSLEFQNFVADIEDLVKASTSLTGDELTRAREQIEARVASAKQSVEKFGGNLAHRARRTATATNNYVHAQPWQAIGLGTAVGFLLGVLFARRS